MFFFSSSCTFAAFEQCTEGTGIGSAMSLCCLHFKDKLSCVRDRQDELAALLCLRHQGIRRAEGQGLKLSWYSSIVSFYFGIDDSLTILFGCKPQSKLSFPGAGTGEQEMALLLVADNPVQLRPSPQGFLKAHSPQTVPELWPHSYSFINQELTNTICIFSLCFYGEVEKKVLLVVVFIKKIA